ncbi:MAG: type III secretion system export apparatus subunit SctU [Parachlamydiales bacterium]|nr:type III secretion system export apparatus subunit SctU [Parachlamydiales bacterium]
MAEKTEKATPKKLRDARKKGQVAKVQDMPSALTFILSISSLVILAPYLYSQLSSFILRIFHFVPYVQFEAQIGGLMTMTFETILLCSLPIMGIVTLFGILINFLLIGPMFSTEILKPDIKKLNPFENIKQKFKLKTVVELLKSIFKIFGAGIIIYIVMKNSLDSIVQTVTLPFETSVIVFKYFLIKIAIYVGIFFIAIALFDLIYQKKSFAKEMKMEKFEVKQEFKDTEGSPEIKNRRRQMAHEIAYDETGPTAVRRAKALITNPLHIAVALGYEPAKYPAPYILTMGMDAKADAMVQVALQFGIPIMRNVPLARQLFETGKIMDYIPKDTYDAVAEVLRYIASLEEENEES